MNIRTCARAAFACYALALVTATHWPALKIASHGVNRLDLFIHAGAFGTWTRLLTLGGFFGPALSRQNILRSTAAALAYALLDELTQGLPVLQRTVDPLDMAANAAGIVLVGLAMLLLARRLEPAPAADNP